MSDTPPSPGFTNQPEERLSWLDRHLWQIQPVRDVLVGLAVFGLFWIGDKTAIVTVPLLLALLFAYLFEPVIRWITERTRLDRRGAVAAILVGALVVVGVPTVLGTIFGVAQLVGFVTETAHRVDVVSTSVMAPRDEIAAAQVEEAGPAWVWIRDQAWAHMDDPEWRDAFDTMRVRLKDNAGAILNSTASAGADVLLAAIGIVGGVFGLIFTVFLTSFFFYFIATSWTGVQKFSLKLIPDKHRDLTVHLAKQFDKVIAGFVRGRLTIAFIQAIVFSVAYWIIGVPASFLLGPLVAILSIVPYLAMVGIPISIALLWLEAHTGLRGTWWWVLGAPLAVYFIGQALDDYVLTPSIQGKETGMDTPTILFATLAGGALFGVFGMLIAIPIAACVKIVIQEVLWPRFKAWAEGRRADPLPID